MTTPGPSEFSKRVMTYIAQQRDEAGLEPLELPRRALKIHEVEAHAEALGIAVDDLVIGALDLGETRTELAFGAGARVDYVRTEGGRRLLMMRISRGTIEVDVVDLNEGEHLL